jgi:hypothetical protein
MWTGTWPSQDMGVLQRNLTDLVELVEHPAPDQPDDVARSLARFLVVRSCGYLEQVVEECCRAYLTSKGSPRTAAFGHSWFGRGANPSPAQLVVLVRRFDQTWASELEALLDDDDEELKRDLSFLVDRRNKIAHGLSEGLGARKTLDLVAVAEMVADWFIVRFDPR